MLARLRRKRTLPSSWKVGKPVVHMGVERPWRIDVVGIAENIGTRSGMVLKTTLGCLDFVCRAMMNP